MVKFDMSEFAWLKDTNLMANLTHGVSIVIASVSTTLVSHGRYGILN